ncbi:MAG: hypothetical protein GX617_02445 [Lentisphaerae bacterium]|nr:hypothetical protein [Lentisphaerota bacterium]
MEGVKRRPKSEMAVKENRIAAELESSNIIHDSPEATGKQEFCLGAAAVQVIGQFKD